ncbi:unnamed protein product [Chrysodeixis includens]|uniref:Uncharacterized protein n=1 Tax=Chrysodeixis includens TaxID=689277 RepID=A0A9N8KU61_CHRIL|nr:unnamed protein product [Chrysodeixis includens]
MDSESSYALSENLTESSYALTENLTESSYALTENLTESSYALTENLTESSYALTENLTESSYALTENLTESSYALSENLTESSYALSESSYALAEEILMNLHRPEKGEKRCAGLLPAKPPECFSDPYCRGLRNRKLPRYKPTYLNQPLQKPQFFKASPNLNQYFLPRPSYKSI